MEGRTNERLDWDDVRIFLAVARAGTLSGAARDLRLGVATVSRRIARLEAALGLPLLSRHESGCRLTADGAALTRRAEDAEDAIRGLRSEAGDAAAAAGRVRVATAENVVPILLPALGPLLRAHPRLSVEIVADVAAVNLHRGDADLAIRMVRPERGDVSVRRLGTLGFGLYASPAYLRGRDASWDRDPAAHSFIGWTERQAHLPAARWMERALKGRAPAVTAATLSSQLAAAAAGLGLAVLPHFLALEAGLTAVRRDLGVDQPIWLVIHSDLAGSRRVRLVADHLAAAVEENARRLAEGSRPAP